MLRIAAPLTIIALFSCSPPPDDADGGDSGAIDSGAADGGLGGGQGGGGGGGGGGYIGGDGGGPGYCLPACDAGFAPGQPDNNLSQCTCVPDVAEYSFCRYPDAGNPGSVLHPNGPRLVWARFDPRNNVCISIDLVPDDQTGLLSAPSPWYPARAKISGVPDGGCTGDEMSADSGSTESGSISFSGDGGDGLPESISIRGSFYFNNEFSTGWALGTSVNQIGISECRWPIEST